MKETSGAGARTPPRSRMMEKSVWQLSFHLRGHGLRLNRYETFQGFLRVGGWNARHYIQKNELRVIFLDTAAGLLSEGRERLRRKEENARAGVAGKRGRSVSRSSGAAA